MNYASLFAEAASRFPDRTAIIDGESALQYDELDAQACRFAHAALGLGLSAQDRVAVVADNSERYVEALLGCLKADLVACLPNTRLSADEVARILGMNPAEVIVYDKDHREHALRGAQSCRKAGVEAILVPIDREEANGKDRGESPFREVSYDELVAGEPASFDIVDCGDGDVAIQLFTSGTTGFPKSMPHTHESLVMFDAMYGYAAKHGVPRDALPVHETFLCMLPIYHVSGITALYALATGGTVVFQHGFDMRRFLGAIQDHRVTRTTVAQTVAAWIAQCPFLDEYDLSSLIEIAYGGAPMPESIERAITERLSCSLCQAYGSTEVLIATLLSGYDHVLDSPEKGARLASVGRPMVGCDVKVVDDSGNRLSAGIEGEICVKSPAAAKGMERRWVRMGDMGHMDEEGFVYLTGRKNDLIISGGENIYPAEVEACIREIDGVADVAVVGVEHPKWGQTPFAFVVRDAEGVTERSVVAHCERRIARYKRPSRVAFIDRLPKNELGKLDRKKLLRMAHASCEANPL